MPATPTLPAGIVNKISARNQAVRWTVTLKEVRVFSAYCCNIDSDSIMGVAKQPVPIVSISPNPVCLGESIDWDLTDSYAPGSTISSWEIDFGDASSDTGASIGTAFGSHTYAAVGEYTVTVTIEEGTGRNTTITREVNVVDCSEPPVRWVYASTYGEGVWFLDRNAGDTTWQSRNNGLTGDALHVNSMVMKPGQSHLPDGSHEIWIATVGGVYKSENSGKSWSQVPMGDPSNAEFGDVPSAIEDELNWIHIVFDPVDANTIYIEAERRS